MHLRIAHSFACDPDTYWTLLKSDAFEEAQRRIASSRRDPVESCERPDGTHHRRVRITPTRQLPAIVRKLLGRELQYDQILDVDAAAGVANWTLEVAGSRGRVHIGGTLKVSARAHGCERVIEGQVRVDVPVVGRKAEGVIATEIERGYTKAARAMEGLIDG